MLLGEHFCERCTLASCHEQGAVQWRPFNGACTGTLACCCGPPRSASSRPIRPQQCATMVEVSLAHAIGKACVCFCFYACLSPLCLAIFHLSGGGPGDGAGTDCAFAYILGRLRRHGVTGPNVSCGDGWLRLSHTRFEQYAHQLELAMVARIGFCAAHRHRMRNRDWLAFGANRRHLHHHDHARLWRCLLLFGASKLHRL